MARRAAAKSDATAIGADTRILVLCGTELMLKQEAMDQLKAVMEAAHGEIERFSFDGKSAPLADVLDECRGYSLMQTHKLVVVDDADVFVSQHREPLERYAQAPVDHATLVLRSVKWNKGNLDKHIEKVGAVVKCDPLPIGDVPRWVMRRSESVHDKKIDAACANLLAERLGSDLMRLDSELGKLAAAAGDAPIDAKTIEQIVGRASDEDAWAIQEAVLAALASRGRAAAGAGSPVSTVVDMLHELIELSGQPDVLVVYFVADLMRKLQLGMAMKRQGAAAGIIAKELKLWGPRQHAFIAALDRLKPGQVEQMFDRIVEYDARSKTGRGEPLRNLECFCALMADSIN